MLPNLSGIRSFEKDRILQLFEKMKIPKNHRYCRWPTDLSQFNPFFKAPDTQNLTFSGKIELVYEYLIVNILNY